MKSPNIMRIGKLSDDSLELFLRRYKGLLTYFATNNLQTAYKLSFVCDFNIVIVDEGLDLIEEQNLIQFFNENIN